MGIIMLVLAVRGGTMLVRKGEEHDVVAVSDAVIFLSSQKETPVIGI
jgi:hypothetical protein